jgi:adenylyltransferase/sulfurtransferase
MPNFQDLLRKVKSEITEISVDELKDQLTGADRAVIVDVREPDEVVDGIIKGAIAIPRGFLELRIEQAVPDKEQDLVVYCQGGVRSAMAAKALGELGYTQVKSMAGGFGAWKRGGHSFVMPRTLNAEQRARYGRHLILPEVGEEGQIRLLESRVLLVGAGGLGSPTALYLAAAGVGTLGIIDMDVVDASNLQRQILHNNDRIGEPKVESARKTLELLNPDVKVNTYNERLTRDNALELFGQYDVVVDGADNFATRYLVNDACVLSNVPNVHGSIFRFEGQATVFKPHDGPCYRCLYPEPPPPGLAPSCAEAGVLGVLPGIVGCIQAMETVKLILDEGDSLVGRLLNIDALGMNFKKLNLQKDPGCPICGENPEITELIDYEYFCSLPSAEDALAPPSKKEAS